MPNLNRELYLACDSGRVRRVREILDCHHRVDVNWMNDYNQGITGLHVACIRGHLEIISLLLRHPCIDVNQKDNCGRTPFYVACAYGRSSVVALMSKDSRVLINEPNENGFTPLSRAAYLGHPEVINAMIASGRLFYPGHHSGNDCAIVKARSIGNAAVVSLLERYKDHPDDTRHLVRLEVGWYDSMSAEVFSMVVLLCDDYFVLGERNGGDGGSKTRRFFAIVQQLPMELQMFLCCRVGGSTKERIAVKDIDLALKSSFGYLCAA
jgi:hypothetical protein